MTKPAHTTPPPDAVARRRAPPVLTYSIKHLPSLDVAFYNSARVELSKVAELTVPRDAKAIELPAGHFFRIVSVDGPQVGDLNILARMAPGNGRLRFVRGSSELSGGPLRTRRSSDCQARQLHSNKPTTRCVH